MSQRELTLHICLALILVAVLAACASIGRPEGGPKDELPPVYVRSNPAPGALNYDKNHLEIFFDENVKVEDVMNKVVVSPVQISPARVTANGKRLSVELQDTLKENTTYTIDFSDAIRDLNEGNILDGFAFDFSTGDVRDSLVISGMLFEARTLEPAQGIIVGAYSNLADSAIMTLPFERIAKTNQYGQFVLRNLAPGTYNIFAINDMNRDFHWDRTENIAFLDSAVTPTVVPIVVTDTLRASNGLDSIVGRAGVKYLPNDVLLTWFNENYRSQYLKNSLRQDSTRVRIEFGAPSDTFPTLTLLNTPAAGKLLTDVALLEYNSPRDTLTYWLTERAVMQTDTLLIKADYLRTDSLEQLKWTTDTLRLVNKSAPKKQVDDKKKDKEKAKKADADSVAKPEITFLEFEAVMRGNQDVNRPLRFVTTQPIARIEESAVRLEVRVDTNWVDLGPQKLVRDSVNSQIDYSLHYRWEPGEKYRFVADSAAITGIYGIFNDRIEKEFSVKSMDEYSSLTLNLTGYDPEKEVVVELLDKSDAPIASKKVRDGSVTFNFLAPDTYYARAFVDFNGNGVWDTGNLQQKLQPDETYYYPKKLTLKKNWDVSQTWNINELPLDKQKPIDIKKNRPKTKETQPKPTDEEEDEDSMYPNGKNNSGFGSGSGGFGSGNSGYGSGSGGFGSAGNRF